MKNKSKAPSQKQLPCKHHHCSGAQNGHENYISNTSRHATNSPSKKKKKSKTKKVDEVNQLLKQSYSKLKQENQYMSKKIKSQKKKIAQLKEINLDYQMRLKIADSRTKDNSSPANNKLTQIVSASQNLTKQTLEKYRALQQQYNNYIQKTENAIQKLNRQLAQSYHSKQVEQLKKQLRKFREEQLTATSLKTIKAEKNEKQQKNLFLISENQRFIKQIDILKSQLKRLKNHNENLQYQLKSISQLSKNKEDQLRHNLDIINEKVIAWETEYRQMQHEVVNWEDKYNRLSQKYEKRRLKQRKNNEEWAQIFRQFLVEIQKLKRQLEMVSQKNMKLIKMYVDNN